MKAIKIPTIKLTREPVSNPPIFFFKDETNRRSYWLSYLKFYNDTKWPAAIDWVAPEIKIPNS